MGSQRIASPFTEHIIQQPSIRVVKMSLKYGVGGATTALAVVGAYMLFTGDGEAFNFDHLLLKDQGHGCRCYLLRKQLLYRICSLLGWPDSGNVQLDLWCISRHQR